MLIAEAKVQRKIELRVFNKDNGKISELVVRRLLAKAHLKYKGYKKTVILKIEKKENSRILKQKVARFTKRVPCLQLLQVEKELSSLLPGVFDSNIAKRVGAEVAGKTFGGRKNMLCTGGVEIHFPPTRNFCQKQKNKRGFAYCGIYCLFCFWAEEI